MTLALGVAGTFIGAILLGRVLTPVLPPSFRGTTGIHQLLSYRDIGAIACAVAL